MGTAQSASLSRTLNPLTIYRTHPLEGIIFTLRASFTQGTAISTFIFLFGNNVDLLTILGANIFILPLMLLVQILDTLTFTLDIGGGWNFFNFPAQHQIHHSLEEKHYDKILEPLIRLGLIGGSLHTRKKKA